MEDHTRPLMWWPLTIGEAKRLMDEVGALAFLERSTADLERWLLGLFGEESHDVIADVLTDFFIIEDCPFMWLPNAVSTEDLVRGIQRSVAYRRKCLQQADKGFRIAPGHVVLLVDGPAVRKERLRTTMPTTDLRARHAPRGAKAAESRWTCLGEYSAATQHPAATQDPGKQVSDEEIATLVQQRMRERCNSNQQSVLEVLTTERTQRDLAARLNVSGPRVSQLKQAAFHRLETDPQVRRVARALDLLP